MGFFNFLISSALAVISPGDGWYPVEKPPKVQEQADERNSSIWVLFSKKLENEKFLVRFPDEPEYKYTESGLLEIKAEREGEVFMLRVGQNGESKDDLFYFLEGKWVREHFVQTEHYLFHFITSSNRVDDANHLAFISSFLIEKSN